MSLFLLLPTSRTTVPSIYLGGATGYGNGEGPSRDIRTSDPNPVTALGGWFFNTDGSVDRYMDGSIEEYDTAPLDNWYNPNGSPDQTYYIRFTHNAGDTVNNVTTGSWLALSSQRSFYHSEGVSAFGNLTVQGQYLVEISSDASGSPVVATGYFDVNIAVAP